MNILVTGATGFIGSHLIQLLSETGHQVTCLVRKTSHTALISKLKLNIIFGDVTDPVSVRAAVKGQDCLINLANLYSFWEPDPSIYRKVNVDGTRIMMDSALEAGVAKVIHISTCGVYGRPKDVPFTESSEVGPERFSEYFRTKYEGDMIAWDLYEKKKLPLVMVYPMAVLGPGDPKATGQYIQRLVRRRLPARVLEDAVFTFVDVRDVADIIYRAMMKEGNIGERYFAGTVRLTWGELNRMVAEISGVALPRLYLPDFLVVMNAWLLTKLADIIKRPPLWGLAKEQIRTMKEGVRADGSKATRELCIEYTPIREAIKECIAEYYPAARS